MCIFRWNWPFSKGVCSSISWVEDVCLPGPSRQTSIISSGLSSLLMSWNPDGGDFRSAVVSFMTLWRAPGFKDWVKLVIIQQNSRCLPYRVRMSRRASSYEQRQAKEVIRVVDGWKQNNSRLMEREKFTLQPRLKLDPLNAVTVTSCDSTTTRSGYPSNLYLREPWLWRERNKCRFRAMELHYLYCSIDILFIVCRG